MKFEVDGKLLQAVALHAAKKDIRKCLTGVLVELSSRSGRLVASNGNSIIVSEIPGIPELVGRVNFIIPVDVIPKTRGFVRVVFEGKTGMNQYDLTITDTTKTTSVSTVSIDGVYPDYRRLFTVDSSELQGTAWLNPVLLSLFSKSKALIAGSTNDINFPPRYFQTGSKTATRVWLDEKTVGLLAPMEPKKVKTDTSPEPEPDFNFSWVKEVV